MAMKVCKFGGTSLATRAQVEKALEIMLADRDRRYMVVSAPGARRQGDVKVTDLLIRAAAEYRQAGNSASADEVVARFREIVPEDEALSSHIRERLFARLSNTGAANYEEAVKAFGEYGSACVVASILKSKGKQSEMLEPGEMGFVITGRDHTARPDPRCYRKMRSFLKTKKGLDIAVVPGFYGYSRAGELLTLPRGGSDTSGAVVARAAGADVYENWTDEDGLRRADPRVVPGAATIPEMTYDEARELAYMGFKLQDACFEPIKGSNIVLTVKNTNNPSHPGTRIVDSRQVDPQERIVGVACEKDFVSIGMRKLYIDKEVGFGRRMFSVSEKLGLPYEHTLDGVDSAALVLAKKYLKGERALETVVERLKRACKPDEMMINEFALISVAGIGMKHHYDVHARTFSALARVKAAIRMIDEGADDLSFFIGVDGDCAADAVRAIYDEFYPSSKGA
jgi:aspartate kinase